jgi:polysaccharide biosynthesis transport protein
MTLQQNEFPQEIDEPSASHLVHAALSFLRLVQCRKNVMFAALVIALLLGGLYFITATRYYEADASLLILQTGGDVLTTSMPTDGGQQEIIPTYCQLIKSAIVLHGAIPHLNAKDRIDLHNVPREEWVKTLQANLAAVAVRRTNIIHVTYRSKSPTAASAVVRAVIESYFEFINKTHRSTADEIMTVLTQEKVRVEESLEQRQAQLLVARREYGDLGIKSGGSVVHPLVQRAIRLNEALVEVQEKRIEQQATLAAVQKAVQNGEELQHHILAAEEAVGREILLAGLGFNNRDATVQANMERSMLQDQSELETLRRFYGPNHPRLTEVAQRIETTRQYLGAYQSRVNKRLTQLKDTQLGPMLVQMLSQALAKTWQKESTLRASFETARADAVRLNGRLAQLDILEHDVDRLRSFLDVLINQIANTDLRQEHGDVQATIVKNPAAPSEPVSPRLAAVVLLCLVLALLAGGISIYVLDILDDRFRSPEELRLRLGTPVLAMVRQLDSSDTEGLAGVQTNVAPDAVESEAFRTLRTALAFNSRETERLVISSSEPGDGKTTVLVNLAVAYAQAGKRTLLIDADLRRPGLTNLLGMKGQPGVSDVLRSEEEVAATAQRCVQNTERDGLDVLASGPRRPNPSELLVGPRFADLLVWAESLYDQVLVDSPPVLAASDAQILGRLVDGVVLVVQPDRNRRRIVERAVESFTAIGVHLLGVVANRVDPDANSGYGYGYGYGYQYQDDSETEKLPAYDIATDEVTTAQGDRDAPDAKATASLPRGPSNDPPHDGQLAPKRVA